MCYTTLNLCLLAIEQRKYEGGDIFINPKEKVINPNAIGMQNLNFFTLPTVHPKEIVARRGGPSDRKVNQCLV